MVRSINKSVLDDKQLLVDYLRDQERELAAAHRKIDELRTSTTKTVTAIANRPVDTKSLEAKGISPLNVTGLTGKLSEPQYADVPLLTVHPDPLTAPYNLYVLLGAPNSLWIIKRDVNPPTKFQIL